MNLIEKIQQSASRNLSAPAFIHNGRVLTYRNFYELLCAAAKVMHQNGFRPGDVIGLSLGQSPLHVIVMLALARLGAVSVPVHPALPLAQRQKLVTKYGVRAIVSNLNHCRIAETDFIKLDSLTADAGESDRGITNFRPDDQTPFRISLSSGTTGEPKGVLLTQGNLLDRIEKMLYGRL